MATPPRQYPPTARIQVKLLAVVLPDTDEQVDRDYLQLSVWPQDLQHDRSTGRPRAIERILEPASYDQMQAYGRWLDTDLVLHACSYGRRPASGS